MDGVWVVYFYDVNAVPVAVFPDELTALKISNDLGYTNVKFWKFNELWEHLHRR